MDQLRDQNQNHKKKKMSGGTPISNLADIDSPPNGEVRDQNSLSLSSAQTLNYHPPCLTEPNPNPPPPSTKPQKPSRGVVIRYRECLKNHAAAIGGHVVDGCGEFMPGGDDGTPELLKCAACDCHRNFHRRVENLPNWDNISSVWFHHSPMNYYKPPPPQSLAPHQYQSRSGPARPVVVAFGGSNTNCGPGGAESTSSEDDLSNVFRADHNKINNYFCAEAEGSGKKRFRTKFTAEQREKMAAFAEKLGWRISKQEEHELARFCTEMGIKRQVFTVWMHNSKQTMKKKKEPI